MTANCPEPGSSWAAEQQCRDVVLRSALFVDGRDYQAFADLFIEDGVLARAGVPPVRGRAAILGAYLSRSSDRITRHLVTNTVVGAVPTGGLRVVSYVLLWSGSDHESAGQFGRVAHARQVVGEFEDLMVKMDGRWLISRRDARFILYREPAP